MRVSAFVLAASALFPQHGAAAPVASFGAYAESSLTLLSARFVGAPGDAYQYLRLSSVEDAEDSYAIAYNASASNGGDFIYNWMDEQSPRAGLPFTLRSSASGSAFAPDPFDGPSSQAAAAQYAYPAFFFDDAFCDPFCDAVSTIELSFGYSLSASVQVAVGGQMGYAMAEALASSMIRFGIDSHGSARQHLFEDSVDAVASASTGVRLSETASQSRDGFYSIFIRPGEYGYADVYVRQAGGSATVAPVPLPAGLPLLGAGLAALTLARLPGRPRRRRVGGHCIPERNG